MNRPVALLLAAAALAAFPPVASAQDGPLPPPVRPGGSPVPGPSAVPVPRPAPPASSSSDRRDLRPGDTLQWSVLEHAELGGQLRILVDGTVDVPFAGRVGAVGRTLSDIAADVARALSTQIREPRVSVTVHSLAPNEFYVVGEVGKAGAYQVMRERRVSLLQALGMAGGFAAEADFTRVSVVPSGGRAPRTYDATPGRSTEQLSQAWVEDGDTVVVPQVGRVYLMGQLNRTGGFVPPPGERLTLTRALALGGGFTRMARSGAVLVTPGGQSGGMRYDVDRILEGRAEDPVVLPGYLIFVPERIL